MTLYIALYFVIEILAIISVIKAIMETRTAQGAIAWGIFLVTFPLLALPFYWIFGRNRFHGYITFKESNQKEILQKIGALHQNLKRHMIKKEGYHIDVVKHRIAVLGELAHHETTLLIDGERSFVSIIDGIERAKEYILFQFFIVEKGRLASIIEEALVKKAREGVRIYFLYDEMGSHAIQMSFLRSLRQAGVEVAAFNTTKGFLNRFQLNFRNHRKIVVIDGEECWIGGHNVGDEYINRGGKFSYWRDTHVHIQGPAAIATQLSFVEDWFWAKDEFIINLRWRYEVEPKGEKVVQILPSGPADSFETAKLFFVDLINSARERIWIASPYFVPDDATMSALQLAALNGVDVRILIPDVSDHFIVYMAAFAYFEEAKRAGVKFYRYTKGFMHQKVVLVDNKTSVIGTANFDNRSFRLNFEISAGIYDEAFASEVEQMLVDDIANSKLMHKNRESFLFMFAAKLARLFSPIL